MKLKNGVVKLPKKLKDVFAVLRSGQIESGMAQLEGIKGFEPQKAIALAEIAYFNDRYEEAMTHDESALPHNDQWYAGNVLSEHLYAYTNAALASHNAERARAFYKEYLEEKLNQNLPEHLKKSYSTKIGKHLSRLAGETPENRVNPINDDFAKEPYVEQLKKYRPKLTYDSAEGASYLLNFMFEKSNTKEALDYYETWCEQTTNDELHLRAARLFSAVNEKEKSLKAIMRFVKNWYPVEYVQITPMRLFEFDDLLSILSTANKREILYLPKKA